MLNSNLLTKVLNFIFNTIYLSLTLSLFYFCSIFNIVYLNSRNSNISIKILDSIFNTIYCSSW